MRIAKIIENARNGYKLTFCQLERVQKKYPLMKTYWHQKFDVDDETGEVRQYWKVLCTAPCGYVYPFGSCYVEGETWQTAI